MDTTLPTVMQISQMVARGERSCAEVTETCLARAAEVEGWLHAFAWLDPERTRQAARELDQRLSAGGATGEPARLLAGVPVGVKDIVDTRGAPTECGAALFAGRVPDQSAALVERLEAAGALLFGKTVTAECAFFHPGPTRNPWDRTRTSGGSSMGSAAAVGAGIVPAAVGTQTNGSIIRPAAFCGVVGFKPTVGRISTAGVMRFSATLDQMGGFARTVQDVAWLCAALAGEPLDEWWEEDASAEPGSAPVVGTIAAAVAREVGKPLAGWKLAVARTGEWPHAGRVMRVQFDDNVAALAAAGATIDEPLLPGGLDEVALDVHRTIMQREAADALGPQIVRHPDQVSRRLREYVEGGARITAETYRAALAERERLIAAFVPWAADYDAIVTPPAVGEAPGPETTGDPRFCTRWTLVGAPALTLPVGLGPGSLPLGLQLVGVPGDDRRLLRTAAGVERVLGVRLGPP